MVDTSSFDVERSTSRVQVSMVSFSPRKVSPAAASKAPPIQVVVLVVDVAIPEEFGGGPFNTSLLPLYVNHAARHVWDKKVKFISIYSLKYMSYNIQTF